MRSTPVVWLSGVLLKCLYLFSRLPFMVARAAAEGNWVLALQWKSSGVSSIWLIAG